MLRLEDVDDVHNSEFCREVQKLYFYEIISRLLYQQRAYCLFCL